VYFSGILPLSRSVRAQAVFMSINLKLSHQVEINQAFSLKLLHDTQTQQGSLNGFSPYVSIAFVR
jgi:hypothetical protein